MKKTAKRAPIAETQTRKDGRDKYQNRPPTCGPEA